MPTTSSTFTDLYAPGLRKIIFESYTYLPTQYQAINNVASSKRQYEDDYQMGGFGSVPTKPEGTNIVYDDPVPGATVRYVWTPHGKGFRATHESMMDDLYGPMRRMATALGRAFRNQTEIIGMGVWNDAFTGTTHTGFDTLPLCDLAHTRLRGGTSRNEPSTAVDLSVSAMQDAMVDFERLVDESNVPIVIPPRKLLIAPENLPLAREILGSNFKPFTSDNEINILQGEFQLVVNHFLTDTDSWFMLGDKADTDVWVFWREKFSTDAADDFDSGDGKIKGYMRLGVGFGDWRGVWGSPGI